MADGTHDDLPADDHAYALLPERRRARIQVVSDGNMYLDAALLLDEYLDVTTVPTAKYPSEGQFDVTIFDNVAPTVAAGSGHVLYLNPSGSNLPFTVDKEVTDDDPNYQLGFDEIDTKSPLVRYTALSDVQISRAHILKGSKEDKVVGSSFKGPILISGRRGGSKFVALGFDIRESDLPLRISWPLFLLDTINDFVEEDTSYISSFTTGQVFRVPAPSGVDVAELLQPGGDPSKDADWRQVPVEDGRAVFLGEHAGFYTLRTEDKTYETMFAANLSDPVESDIEPVKELKVGKSDAGEPSGFTVGVRREFWIYLLIAVIGISAIEWLTFHRRVTV
jgi:hypothetical protein